jgi:hypothetical protein
MQFRKIRSVTLPVLKMTEGVERFFKFVSEMYLGKQIDDKKEPATLAQVIDLETDLKNNLNSLKILTI